MICFVLFRNGHFHNVVSTFTNVVHINVENDNVVSTLSNVVYINVEIHNVNLTLFDVVNSNVEVHNVVSMLIWGCPTSRRRINQKAMLKQRWNACWVSNLNKKLNCTLFWRSIFQAWHFFLKTSSQNYQIYAFLVKRY